MTSRQKIKGRKESGLYFGLPHAVMDSHNYLQLSAHAVKLLNDLGRQYRGYNNGDLCATWSMMEKRGWKSRSTLFKALKDLLYYGLIIKSKQGGKHAPSLYAVTWKPIDDCKGKLDIKETIIPTGDWKVDKPNIKIKSVARIESTLTRIAS